MERGRLNNIIIGVLVVINLLLIAALILGRPNRRPEPQRHIIKTLKLDNQQTIAYKELIAKHQVEVLAGNIRLNKLKGSLYHTLTEPSESNNPDALFSQISLLQDSLERINYDHFKDIKALCRPDQQKDFEKLSAELLELFKGRRK